jgi:transposase
VLTPALEARILAKTQQRPPDGSTHWSTRKLARVLKIHHNHVQTAWTRAGVQPHRFERYMRSDDPDFEPKAADVIGLYLQPPQHAAVFAADEKTAIQALDRLDPVLPLSPGRVERHGFEYYRHGTLSLFAALNTKTGEVLGQTVPRHTSAAFVAFLGDIVASQPRQREIHVILDNLSTHKTRAVAAFLEAHPHVHLHFTPTYASWLNQVELWFGRIERDLLTRGIFTSVNDLARQIRRYIRHYNDVAKPIRWKYCDPTRRITGSTSVSTGH